MSNQYRKKPVVIEAFQMTLDRIPKTVTWPAWLIIASNKGANEDGSVFWPSLTNQKPEEGVCIRTLEGVMTASPDDWIIQGVSGELYPCKPDIFEQTYESVQES